MKKILITLLLATLFASLAQARTWTSTFGSTVEGDLTAFIEQRFVKILTGDGRSLSVPIEKLSDADQAYVKEWFAAKSGGIKVPTAASGELNAGLAELLPEKLLDASGSEVSRNQLAGKTVGFYFSAHWCPPCRAFTPSLVKFRDANQEDFEIVFVSSDKDPGAQMNYMKETNMKWLTMKHRSKEANALGKKYGVRGIPALIIVSPEGEIITKDGRSQVSSNPKGALASWQKS